MASIGTVFSSYARTSARGDVFGNACVVINSTVLAANHTAVHFAPRRGRRRDGLLFVQADVIGTFFSRATRSTTLHFRTDWEKADGKARKRPHRRNSKGSARRGARPNCSQCTGLEPWTCGGSFYCRVSYIFQDLGSSRNNGSRGSGRQSVR